MKKSLLLLNTLFASIFFFMSNNNLAQCSRTTTFQNGHYTVIGNAELKYETNGTKTLSFTGFSTTTGPDVDVYLSNSNNGIGDAILISDLNYSSSSQYTIPSNVNINDYQYVLLWCTTYSEWWGYGTLSTTTGPDCSTLSIAENTLSETVKIFPNPLVNNLNISNPKQLSLSLSIFDLLGNEAIHTKESSSINQNIILTSLKSGLYLLKIQNDESFVTKKFIKQ